MKKLMERQVFVTWYTPEEKNPEDGRICVVTISGKSEAQQMEYDHTFALGEWFDDGRGWNVWDMPDDADIEVLAWCDLDPYGGEA